MHSWIGRNADGRSVILGSYTDAADLRSSATLDSLAARLLAESPGAAVAHLGSAVDSYARDVAAKDSDRRIGASRPTIEQLLGHHGPAAALAGRITRWRCLVSAQRGHAVSFNVAPPTFARRRRILPAVRRNARHFGVEIMPGDTAQFLMAALLVHDLHQPCPATALTPESIFTEQAMHGGLWRCAPSVRRLFPIAAAIGVVAR